MRQYARDARMQSYRLTADCISFIQQPIPALPHKSVERQGLSNVDLQVTHTLLEFPPKRDEEGFPPVSGCLTI